MALSRDRRVRFSDGTRLFRGRCLLPRLPATSPIHRHLLPLITIQPRRITVDYVKQPLILFSFTTPAGQPEF